MPHHSGNQLIDPYVIFGKARLQPGMHVADFGCGSTGHIVFPAAPIIGEDGIIFAVDVQKSVLEQINKRSKMQAWHQIHTVWSNVENIGKTAIPERSIDIVFLVNTLCQGENRHAMLEEAKRVAKPKARILVVDWKQTSGSLGPQDSHLVNFPEILDWARAHGMGVQEEFEAGPYHHGVVLYRND